MVKKKTTNNINKKKRTRRKYSKKRSKRSVRRIKRASIKKRVRKSKRNIGKKTRRKRWMRGGADDDVKLVEEEAAKAEAEEEAAKVEAEAAEAAKAAKVEAEKEAAEAAKVEAEKEAEKEAEEAEEAEEAAKVEAKVEAEKEAAATVDAAEAAEAAKVEAEEEAEKEAAKVEAAKVDEEEAEAANVKAEAEQAANAKEKQINDDKKIVELKAQEAYAKVTKVKFDDIVKDVIRKVQDSDLSNKEKKDAVTQVIKDHLSGMKDPELKKNLESLVDVINKIEPESMTEDNVRKLCQEQMNKLKGIHGSNSLMNNIISFGSGALLTFLLAEGIPLVKNMIGGDSTTTSTSSTSK